MTCHEKMKARENGICGKQEHVIEEHSGYYGYDRRVRCEDGHTALLANGSGRCDTCCSRNDKH